MHKSMCNLVFIIVINVVVMSMLYSELEKTRNSHRPPHFYARGKYNLDSLQNESIAYVPLQKKLLKTRSSSSTKQICSKWPPGLLGKVKVPTDNSTRPSWGEISEMNHRVLGGSYSPEDCTARFRVAIIIPYRDRLEHLKMLLGHLHPVLQRQEIDYTIYTITFAGEGVFNKAKLMNAGFIEASKDRQFDCFVFHDVDILTENDNCLYWCSDEPRQIAYHLDKFKYEPLEYTYLCRPDNAPVVTKIFGGVVLFTPKLFIEVNGFSNLYWGWGGEDDDMYWRIWSKNHKVLNPYGDSCSFSMVKHGREEKNSANPGRMSLVYHSIGRMQYDGLSNLRYKRTAFERYQLYVNVTVDVGRQDEKMKRFVESDFQSNACNEIKMPWE